MIHHKLMLIVLIVCLCALMQTRVYSQVHFARQTAIFKIGQQDARPGCRINIDYLNNITPSDVRVVEFVSIDSDGTPIGSPVELPRGLPITTVSAGYYQFSVFLNNGASQSEDRLCIDIEINSPIICSFNNEIGNYETNIRYQINSIEEFPVRKLKVEHSFVSDVSPRQVETRDLSSDNIIGGDARFTNLENGRHRFAFSACPYQSNDCPDITPPSNAPNHSTATVFTLCNRNPSANNYSATLIPNTSLAIERNELGISDPDENPTVNIVSTTQPTNGHVTINQGGFSIVYTPDRDFVGIDTFQYTVADQFGGRASANVTVTVGNSKPPLTCRAGFTQINIVTHDAVLTQQYNRAYTTQFWVEAESTSGYLLVQSQVGHPEAQCPTSGDPICDDQDGESFFALIAGQTYFIPDHGNNQWRNFEFPQSLPRGMHPIEFRHGIYATNNAFGSVVFNAAYCASFAPPAVVTEAPISAPEAAPPPVISAETPVVEPTAEVIAPIDVTVVTPPVTEVTPEPESTTIATIPAEATVEATSESGE